MAGYYNGFTPAQRARGGREVNAAWRRGELERPTVCEACGATAPDARIGGHNEDYDTPLDYFSVCFVCHMMIHNRFRAKAHWRRYLRLLAEGAIMAQVTDWLTFRRWYLQAPMDERVVGWGEPRSPSFLNELPLVPQDHPPAGLVPARLKASRDL